MRFGYRTVGMVLCALVAMTLPVSGQTPRVLSSLLLLIDTSGSMDEEIGSGNTDIKMEAAKAAAIAAVESALANRATEVAVLGFSGECQNPVSERLDFTTDLNRLTRFINGLQAGGSTPMADAVLVANRFMQANGSPRARSQMIVLLADGNNDCGNVAQAMAELQAAGIVFRHETVGFGIAPTSAAARDLRHVATTSGGQYHHAASATQLADVFMEFTDTFTVIELLGTFGGDAQPNTSDAQTAAADAAATAPSTQHDSGVMGGPDGGAGRVTDMIGMFKTEEKKDVAGALAIDADQGTKWGWAAGHATVAAAEQAALRKCGLGCRVALSFEQGCAAYAADQTRGSTASGWAIGLDTELQATRRALDECRQRGGAGADCIVRAWACGDDGIGGGAASSASSGQGPVFAGDAKKETAGALAIDAPQGSASGWAVEHATVAAAEQSALEQCGAGCQVVVSFEAGCAAYAADQTEGSTASGWASGLDTKPEATQAGLEECRKRGGSDCIVRVWACGDGTGGGAPASVSAGPDAAPMADAFGEETNANTAGALAIDDHGTAGWTSGYATVAEAERRALEICDGDTCRIVMSFEAGCAAYAADQTEGSTASGWASGFDTKSEATQAGLEECREGGGEDCRIDAWTCDGASGP